jgi:ferredoxin
MKRITPEALATWLDILTQRTAVIAPRLVEHEILYRPVASSDEIQFDFERAALSPKSFFLPETQVIFEIERGNQGVTLAEPAPGREQVIFGIRPCDARGLQVLDALLLEHAPADVYYAERREKTILIGLACPRLWEGCFCTSLGGAPDSTTALDLMLYEEESGYLLLELTGKGSALLEGLQAEDVDRETPVSEASAERVPVLPPEAWPGLFDDLYWRRLAERCLSCHACTYVCPTCRCFDVRDDTVAAGPGYAHIRRLRAWDSCMASAYRRIAGGHNPRPVTAQRLRNRYYCKFCYSPLDFGVVACVGCGRCIAVCPVGIDITEMLAHLPSLQSGDLME